MRRLGTTVAAGFGLAASMALCVSLPLARGEVFDVSDTSALESALGAAQANDEDDTIKLRAGTCIVSSTLVYSTDDGDWGHALSIVGAGASSTILDGAGGVRIMSLEADSSGDGGDAGGSVFISGLAFRSAFGGGDGGALWAATTDASVVIEECAFEMNQSFFGQGGALYVETASGQIRLAGNRLSENLSDGAGGAYLQPDSGSIEATANIFVGNSSGGGWPGGAFLATGSGAVTITNSVFYDNQGGPGGGVEADTASGRILIVNNTVIENHGFFSGGESTATSSIMRRRQRSRTTSYMATPPTTAETTGATCSCKATATGILSARRSRC